MRSKSAQSRTPARAPPVSLESARRVGRQVDAGMVDLGGPHERSAQRKQDGTDMDGRRRSTFAAEVRAETKKVAVGKKVSGVYFHFIFRYFWF
jgi:hypothetical protein